MQSKVYVRHVCDRTEWHQNVWLTILFTLTYSLLSVTALLLTKLTIPVMLHSAGVSLRDGLGFDIVTSLFASTSETISLLFIVLFELLIVLHSIYSTWGHNHTPFDIFWLSMIKWSAIRTMNFSSWVPIALNLKFYDHPPFELPIMFDVR